MTQLQLVLDFSRSGKKLRSEDDGMLYRIVKLPVRIFGTKDVFYGIRFQPINSILAEMTGGDFAKWSRAGGCWVVVSEAGLERVNPGALIKPSQSMSALQHSRLRLPLANWQD